MIISYIYIELERERDQIHSNGDLLRNEEDVYFPITKEDAIPSLRCISSFQMNMFFKNERMINNTHQK